MLRPCARLACLIVLVLGVGACGGKDGGKDYDLLVYGGSAWFGHAPAWVAMEKGIFEKHGFQVEERKFGSSSERINALARDDAQFASLGEVAMLTGMSRGIRDFYWIGCHNNAPGNEGLVAAQGIASVADLKGKTIALQRLTSVHLTVALLLEDAGLEMGKDVRIVNAPDSSIVDLVRNGDADAGCIWEPSFTALRNLPDVQVLATDKDTSIFKRFGTMTGPDVLCASKTWVDADPDRAKRLFRAYFEAVAWCRDHPEDLVALVHARVGSGMERSDVEAALKNMQWLPWDQQREMLSDTRMFGQAQAAGELLVAMEQMEAVPTFRDWTRLDWFQD